MPSGNTNILKRFIKELDEIKENFFSEYRIKPDDESIRKFADNCEGKSGIDQEIESQKDDLSKCMKFVDELNLVLSTNQLKEDSRYKEYIQEANSYAREYEEAIDKLNQLSDHA